MSVAFLSSSSSVVVHTYTYVYIPTHLSSYTYLSPPQRASSSLSPRRRALAYQQYSSERASERCCSCPVYARARARERERVRKCIVAQRERGSACVPRACAARLSEKWPASATTSASAVPWHAKPVMTRRSRARSSPSTSRPRC